MTALGPNFHITTASDGSHDVWLDFVGDNGRMCSVSIATLAERSGPIVRDTLRGWASRAIASAKEANETSNDYVSDNGQFGAGA